MTDPTRLDPPPGVGRLYAHTARVHLGDAAPECEASGQPARGASRRGGRARLDALARWLQDAAYDDVLDGGAAEDGAWVVRRSELHVEAFPRLGEPLAIETWCDGLGRTRLWAQRRTTIRGAYGALVEAVALWVHLDPATGRPRPLSALQLALWEPSTQGREVRARLTHPAPPPDGPPATAWTFRAADLDVAGHVNNAAYWAVAEEELTQAPDVPLVAIVEHRAAAPAGAATVTRAGPMTWIADRDGTVCASIHVADGRASDG